MSNPSSLAPDIVLVHCHDLGRWLSTYGMSQVPSPNITRFGDTGMVFENAHSAAPLCSPARGSLFTGLSPHRHGLQGLAHHQWRYRKGVCTMPEQLSALGYHTALIGLQHENPDPSVLGFQEVGGVGFLPRVNQVVDATHSWLGELSPRGDRPPVFLTVGVWEVHRPWPAEDYDFADPSAVDVPGYLPDTPDTREDIAAFYGSIRQLDTAMGRLFDALETHLDPEHTLVIFTTDHGAAFPRAKSTLYDAGTGVSLIVKPPRSWQTSAGRVDAMVSHLDVLPTLIEIAGGEPDDQLEGVSLMPLLTGDQTVGKDRTIFTSKSFHDSFDPMRCARSRDFAYIRNLAPGPKLTLSLDLENSPTRRGMGDAHLEPRPQEELYDRTKDPDELQNLAEDPNYESVRRAYAEALDTWMHETGDPLAFGDSIALPTPRNREVDALPPVPPIHALTRK